MSFPNFDNTQGGKDGADITLAQAQDRATYEAQGWLFRDTLLGYWWIDAGSLPFISLDPMGWNYFPNEENTSGGKDGTGIPKTAINSPQTYTATGWDFDTVWEIIEGINRPTLREVPEPPPPPGPPTGWTPPRTDWTSDDYVTHIDMVRIEINIREIGDITDDHTCRAGGVHGVPAGEEMISAQAVERSLKEIAEQLTGYADDRLGNITPPELTVEEVRQAADVPLVLENIGSPGSSGKVGRIRLRTDLRGEGEHYEG